MTIFLPLKTLWMSSIGICINVCVVSFNTRMLQSPPQPRPVAFYIIYSLHCISVLMSIFIIIGYVQFQSIVGVPWLLLKGTFGWVCSAEHVRAQMPQCGCSMPAGCRVKLCTGAPSASHQDHDRWSSVQANFLLLWLCLLSALISNAAMKSWAIGGK